MRFVGSLEKCQRAVVNGADICCVDHNARTTLHFVCNQGHIEIFKWFLSQFQNDMHALKNTLDDDGQAPLHHAIVGKHYEVQSSEMDRYKGSLILFIY